MKRIIICLMCATIVLSLGGCCFESNPPNINAINKLFFKNKAEIDIVANFMVDAEYATMIISDSSGIMLADFQTVEIVDLPTRKAVEHLITKKIVKTCYKKNGSITFEVWVHRQVHSWIGYSIYDIEPKVQYATEVIPMDQEGWYYVIADYNEWRRQKRQGQGDGLREP